MRVLRLVLGSLLVLVSLATLLVGAGLWIAMQHRGPDGGFAASLSPVTADGSAVVVPDVDRLLRDEAPFARGGQTTLRLHATSPLFLGLAPRTDVERYLAGAPYTRLNRVRLARGPLPVDVARVPGDRPVARPAQESFWYAVGRPVGGGSTLTWSPSAVRDRHLALVVMNADGAPGVRAALAASVQPRWLNPTTWGLLILGTVLGLVGAAALAWPRYRREIVYVVEPSQVPEIAARLGVRPLTMVAPPPVAQVSAPPVPAASVSPVEAVPVVPVPPAVPVCPVEAVAPVGAEPEPVAPAPAPGPVRLPAIGRASVPVAVEAATMVEAPVEPTPVEPAPPPDAVAGPDLTAGEVPPPTGPDLTAGEVPPPTGPDLTAGEVPPPTGPDLTWPPARPVERTAPVTVPAPDALPDWLGAPGDLVRG